MGNMRYYSVSVHCRNITAFGEGYGKLNLANAKQQFLYAWGPKDRHISSASKSANIKRHSAYGKFWMDMTKATSTDPEDVMIPTGASVLRTQNAGADGLAQSDGDKVGPAHAALTLAAFAIIFPLGAVLLRFLESVKLHYIFQTIGVLTAVLGTGVGIYLSSMYNHVSHLPIIWLLLTPGRKSQNISSGHQVFGIILLVLLFAQWAIGFFHHLRFRKYKMKTVFGNLHLYAGPILVLAGIINGFTGFNFSDESHNNVYYGAAIAVILVIVLALLLWKRWSKRQGGGERMSHDEELNSEAYLMNRTRSVREGPR